MAFDKIKYDTEYNAKNVTRKFLAFNKNDPDDMELLNWLKGIGKGNVNEYVKGLIRADMENTNIVRCKYCVHWDDHTEECSNPDSVCFRNGWTKPDWFCADGEMRNEDEKNRDS